MDDTMEAGERPSPSTETRHRVNKVVVVGHMPPPITGVASVNAFMCRTLEKNGLLERACNLTPKLPRGGVRYGLARALLTVAAQLSLVARRRRAAVLYMPADGESGLIFNVIIALTGRILGYKMVVHHHNFNYIDSQSSVMAVLLKCLPRGAVHVQLCERMAERFEARYAKAWIASSGRRMVLNNGFMVEVSDGYGVDHGADRPLTIGHLSNLSAAKGSHIFLDVFEQLVERGVPIKAVLAGPAMERDLEARLQSLIARHGDSLRWMGPVWGQSKRDFFEAVDVFVFPTQYPNEAQPLVLIEALSYGLPIVAFGRGCIDCDFDSDVGLIIPTSDDFRLMAGDFIRAIEADPRRLSGLKANALRAALEIRERSVAGLKELVDRLADDEFAHG